MDKLELYISKKYQINEALMYGDPNTMDDYALAYVDQVKKYEVAITLLEECKQKVNDLYEYIRDILPKDAEAARDYFLRRIELAYKNLQNACEIFIDIEHVNNSELPYIRNFMFGFDEALFEIRTYYIETIGRAIEETKLNIKLKKEKPIHGGDNRPTQHISDSTSP